VHTNSGLEKNLFLLVFFPKGHDFSSSQSGLLTFFRLFSVILPKSEYFPVGTIIQNIFFHQKSTHPGLVPDDRFTTNKNRNIKPKNNKGG
jgi:hypothetical protein